MVGPRNAPGPRRPVRGQKGLAAAVVATTIAATTAPRPAAAGDTFLDLFVTVGQNQGADGTATAVTPRLRLGIPAKNRLMVNVEWGLTTVSLPQSVVEGEPRSSIRKTALLNAHVDVSYGARAGPVVLELGLGLAFPFADADDPTKANAYRVARASVGAWNPWLYEPNTLSFTAPVRARYFFSDDFFAGLDGTFFVVVPVEDTDTRRAELRAQAALEVAVRVGWFDIGSRVQAVQIGSPDSDEILIQSSLVPFARLFVGQSVIFDASFNFNFDSPDGTVPGDQGTWGVSIGGSVYF